MLNPEMAILWKEMKRLWSAFSPTKNQLLEEYVVKIPKINKDGSESKVCVKHWPCFICGKLVRERQVDHIDCVGIGPRCEEELPEKVGRQFCSIDNLQILCLGCHSAKTKIERANGWISVADLTAKKTRRVTCSSDSTKAVEKSDKRKKSPSPSSKKTGKKKK